MKHYDIATDNKMLREALALIRNHITPERTRQNADLHDAIGLIVDVARNHGMLAQ